MAKSERLVISENGNRAAFPDRIKKKVIKKGRIVIHLGRGPLNLPEDKIEFWRLWDKYYPDPDALANQFAEVAILPEFVLPDTMDKDPDEQRRILTKRNKQNRKDGFIEVEASALDVVRITSGAFGETGQNFFDQDITTRTKTRIDGTVIYIGGPNGPTQSSSFKTKNVGLAPIAVPDIWRKKFSPRSLIFSLWTRFKK